VVLSWIGIDTYFRAGGEADQRIADLAMLRESASIELVQEALVSAEEPQFVDGLFRLFPKWKDEVLVTKHWIEEQLVLTGRLAELQAELRDFQSTMEPYSGTSDAETWARNLQGWSATESSFAEGREVMSAMGVGVAISAKSDFQLLEETWASELTLRAEAFGGDLTKAIEAAAAIFATPPQGLDLTQLREKLQTLLSPLVQGTAATQSVKAVSPALPPFRDQVARVENDLQKQQADTETAGAELLRLRASIDELSQASGLPTYAKRISDIPDSPGSIRKFLPRNLEADIDTVKKALAGTTRFEELVFADYASLGKLPADPPVLGTPSEELKQNMINLLDDWRLKDIYSWHEKKGGPVNAYSRDKPSRGLSDANTVTWTVEAYRLEESSKLAMFKDFTATDASGGSAASLIGPFPKGKPLLSSESTFFLDLDLHLVFDASTGSFKNSIIGVLDNLIGEANRKSKSGAKPNLVMIAYLHRELGRVISQSPSAWGADLTSFSGDYEALTSLRKDGVTMNLAADDWMVPEVSERWTTTLEVYYLSLTDRSYQREYRDAAAVVKSFAGGVGFEFAGFLDFMGKPQIGAIPVKKGKVLWGIKEDLKTGQFLAAPACTISEDGSFEMLSKTASLSPLFSASEEFDRFFDQVTKDGKLSQVLKYK